MDFDLSEEQVARRDEIVRFATEELNDDVVAGDRAGRFPADAWARCAKAGIQGLPVPPAYGGQGADPVTIAVALEALGYGCRDNGLIFAINAHMWSCVMPILRFGTEEQRQRYLPGLCDGTLVGVQAMTEPETGSDAFAMRTTATPTADGFVLDGVKTYITSAPVADVFVIFATIDREKGIGGLCAFLVERGTPGLTVGAPFAKMGLRTALMSDVTMSGCAVPSSCLIGTVGSGMAIFNHSMEWERSFILASAVGTARRQLERTVEHAKRRRQFGEPISHFQAVSHRIVDMRVRLDAARLLLYQMAWRKGRGKKTAMDAAMVKLALSEMFLESSLDALHLHGAAGYLEDAELERDVRDAVASRIYSGTSEIQKNIIAARMGL